MLIRLLVCGLMGGARLAELAFSSHNLRASGGGQESALNRANFLVIAALNITVIGGTLALGRAHVRRPWLLLLLSVQPLRYWLIATLGWRWNVRGAVPADLEVATNGPYAFVRHPNYSVLMVELAALPAAFGLWRLAMIATLVNALTLTLRIREEEALLFELPGYRQHFQEKKRLLPGIL